MKKIKAVKDINGRKFRVLDVMGEKVAFNDEWVADVSDAIAEILCSLEAFEEHQVLKKKRGRPRKD